MPDDAYFEGFGKKGVGTPGIPEARKDDQGKQRWDLMPFRPLGWIADVVTYGAKKYGPNQWQKLHNGSDRYFAALMRHLSAWRTGETHDEESGLHHLAHAGCCIVFLLWLEGEKQQGKEW